MWMSHLGIGVFIVGVTMVGGLQQSADLKMHPGQHALLAGYTFTLREVVDATGPNYAAARATVELTRGALHVLSSGALSQQACKVRLHALEPLALL